MLDRLNRKIAEIERADPAARAVYGVAERPLAAPRPAVPGHRFHCPVCGGGFRDFLPFGLAGRRNARCPGCGSLERHRFMWLHLRDRLGLARRRARVLHAAPEPCIAAALATNPGLDYVSVDMFDPKAQHHADLTALPFTDASFDAVICSHVLEHIEEDRRAMRELARVLRPRGRAVIMVPIDMKRATYEDPTIRTAAGRNRAFGHPYHVRICGADYPERLAEAGFSVSTVHSKAMPAHRRRLWRINKTVLFDCVRA